AESAFGRLRGAGAPAGPPASLAPSPSRVTVVDHVGGSQASLAVGFVTPDVRHDDNDALELLAEVLGGSLEGRLDRKLRGERGFTYGVSASVAPRRSGGAFRIVAAVESAHAGE